MPIAKQVIDDFEVYVRMMKFKKEGCDIDKTAASLFYEVIMYRELVKRNSRLFCVLWCVLGVLAGYYFGMNR